MVVQLHIDPYMLWFQTDLDYSYTHHQTVPVWGLTTQYSVVTVYGEFFGEPISSPHEVSAGFISLHAKPH